MFMVGIQEMVNAHLIHIDIVQLTYTLLSPSGNQTQFNSDKDQWNQCEDV